MAHSTLTPVFVGLRTGLHVLSAALLTLVVVRVLVDGDPGTWVRLVLAAVFAGVYLLGAFVARGDGRRRTVAGAVWLVALTLVWIALLVGVPEAAYLVFPLFFLYLHVLPRIVGPVAVIAATLVAVVALGLHGGFTVGGVVGPLVGAGVALLIGLGYRALAREAVEREALVAELLATRDRLAVTEREQGVLAERARLAREIHDTVAQGLSSIQMLLHAAERADGERPGTEHIRLARETAAEGLADTRRFIRELAPPALERGLGAALERLAGSQWSRDGLDVTVDVAEASLPMDVQTALLRIAQGAVANVVQHAAATHVRLSLTVDGQEARLTIADDGVGFDPVAVHDRSGTTDSFGLRATEERVEQFGGRLEVDSAPGRGTTLVATLEVR
ncbi:signal transduction histidine kinase [Curtobacterium sp. PhB172]|uniref:sensor histidine kinase n=1 Tax=unclassified Curtobacterium TaxID=257496 RepID=UPI000F4792EF|nr:MULTISPECIES: sensor histidine kinase [unclassified Curtobacterium]ROQ04753.1 signal transduction histidine kinase [Curtobacterium sp. PhB171]ROQ28297.1 signal transduction histidine kinase [Curtobacterium sp. PhB170]ROS33170.1 signal transduction histidine kinase [Curtobacterium sp. PhB131]ROS58483.1 signal transduction histidine kinase [Curtobacterium sp. PhB172]ROS72406.1 signal transduction histidine kinase [Curtobacterium sp. PhB141]